jgi:hypothetical protein
MPETITRSYDPLLISTWSMWGVRNDAISPVTTTSASKPAAAHFTISSVAIPVGRRMRISSLNIREIKTL